MRLNREINCQDDMGQVYRVQEWQEMISVPDLSTGVTEKIPGMKRLRTSSGHHVNPIDKDTFKIIETDTIVRRIK